MGAVGLPTEGRECYTRHSPHVLSICKANSKILSLAVKYSSKLDIISLIYSYSEINLEDTHWAASGTPL